MMAMNQEREWEEAQKITVSIDLVEAAKIELKFLAAVDRNRFLYEDHALERAIYRYNAFWFPLLAKHSENPVSDGPLVVPLDCEWIWHCHRLNPVRYRFDCEKLYGRVLENHNVISSVQATSETGTEDIWSKMYPEEPFELDLNRPFSGEVLQNRSVPEKFTSYDLVSAVKRQISFIQQMSLRPYMSDDLFLQEAAARYKGFLHLVRTRRRTGLELSCVPSYDIDLMWHTHQLHPDSYCKDMKELVGFVVQHDDSDSDKSAGGKLHNGHLKTTNQWERTFGSSYWKAGTMYKGNVPTPVTQVPYKPNLLGKEFKSFENPQVQFTTLNAVEVMLEFADISNLPEDNKQNLVVDFSKSHPDKLFKTKASLELSSNSKEKTVAMFQCEPKREFLFEIRSNSTTSDELNPDNSPKLLGSCYLSLEELLAPRSQLSASKWVPVDVVPFRGNAEPVLLHVFISLTPPTPTPQIFQLVRSYPFENDVIQTVVMDSNGNKVYSLQKRNIGATKSALYSLEEMYYITDTGEKHTLVKFNGNYWSIMGTHGEFKLQNSSEKDGSLFQLVGHMMVKLFPGRRLDFEPRHAKNEESEKDFMTAVEFSTNYPYGKAVALIDSKSETIKIIDEWIVLPGIALAFMLCDFTSKGGEKEKISVDGKNMVYNNSVQEVKGAYGVLEYIPCGNGRKHVPGGTQISKSAIDGDECVDVVKNGDESECDTYAPCLCDTWPPSASNGLKQVPGGDECKEVVKNGEGSAWCMCDTWPPSASNGLKQVPGGGECKEVVKNGEGSAWCMCDTWPPSASNGLKQVPGGDECGEVVKNGDGGAWCVCDGWPDLASASGGLKQVSGGPQISIAKSEICGDECVEVVKNKDGSCCTSCMCDGWPVSSSALCGLKQVPGCPQISIAKSAMSGDECVEVVKNKDGSCCTSCMCDGWPVSSSASGGLKQDLASGSEDVAI